jgi:hypothetical protein
MSIEQNRKTVYIPTPYDDRIANCNDRLNKTYVHYGRDGEAKKEMQYRQDQNAGSYSKSNMAERAVSKSSHAYKNSSWDLVDAAEENEKVITETDDKYLPDEMKGMSAAQRKNYVAQKAEERKVIQLEIQSLNKKRMEYITANTSKGNEQSMLDGALIKAIREQASLKNLKW